MAKRKPSYDQLRDSIIEHIRVISNISDRRGVFLDHPKITGRHILVPWETFELIQLRKVQLEIIKGKGDMFVVGEIAVESETGVLENGFGYKFASSDFAPMLDIDPDTGGPFPSSTETLGRGAKGSFSRGKEK